jgi:vacuolar-type H+-ATPase subunit I/STV1
MNLWTFIAIVAVAGMLFEYLQNKNSTSEKISEKSAELSDARDEMQHLRKRIENLEAIAAGDPSQFSSEWEENIQRDEQEENRNTVASMAQKRRNNV